MELITSWQIYWLTRLDGLQTLAAVSFGISVVATAVSFLVKIFATASNDVSAVKGSTSVLKVSVPVMCVALFTLCFLPTTKEAAAIFAIPAVVNNPQVQSVGTNTLNLATYGMQYLNDLLRDEINGNKNQ